MNASKITACLLIYGLTHALVDASSVLLILGGIDVRDELPAYIILYNVLAFGLQLPFGWLLDKLRQPVLSAVAGCALLSLALMLFLHPLTATIIAGIGNALFHVGGGTVSLNLKPGKASMPGVFVAPGGIGLVAGGMIVSSYGFHPEFFVASLVLMALAILILKSPTIIYEKCLEKRNNALVVIIVLLLVAICIRSVVGLGVEFPWKSRSGLLILITAGIALGKGLGGFLADRFGWIIISVGGLFSSALLIFYGASYPLLGILGLFLLNFAMPVTLVAISNLLPGQPGFSFGLTTFALVAGALPSFSGHKSFLSGEPMLLMLIIFSAIVLYIGLTLYNRTRR